MRISNIRYGFATNSSSSHSVIMMDKLTDVHDQECGGEFGWNFFTAATLQAKALYLAATLKHNLADTLPSSMVEPLVKAWVPEADLENSDDTYREMYVDHQSVISLPYSQDPGDWHTTMQVSKAFFDDLKAYMLDPRILVLGGNDNDDAEHPLAHLGKEVLTELGSDYQAGTFLCSKQGDWWVIYQTKTGNRVTFSFKDNPVPLTKFDTPLLVDMKITNACNKGCSFCYQDSTPEGKHAPINDIAQLIYVLQRMGVFEVALGGGEPTLHPQFPLILRRLKEANITPNFTTRDFSWLKKPEYVHAVEEYCGAVAISVSTVREVNNVQALKMKYPHIQFAIQIIPALLSRQMYREILDKAKWLPVTLLGLKHTGRAADLPMTNPSYDWFEEIVDLRRENKYCLPRLAIDTALARQSRDILKRLDSEMVTWFTDEGGRSMYLDAVEGKIAPSSYSKPEAFLDYQNSWAIKDLFAKLPVEND